MTENLPEILNGIQHDVILYVVEVNEDYLVLKFPIGMWEFKTSSYSVPWDILSRLRPHDVIKVDIHYQEEISKYCINMVGKNFRFIVL